MAIVRTIARTFMKGHPREGEQTFFVEKFLNSLGVDYHSEDYYKKLLKLNGLINEESKSILVGNKTVAICDFWHTLSDNVKESKHHTIRGGHPDKFKEHFKQGDKVSIRCWSGKPYASPQIILCNDVKLKEVYEVEIIEPARKVPHPFLFIKGALCGHNLYDIISNNDGLSPEDMSAWFNKLPFKGQILVWGNVKY
jgi:hypothetical protein